MYAIQFLLNTFQRKQPFPQSKSQRRSHLQDGNAILHHFPQALPRLVIRGMALKDKVRVIFQACHQFYGSWSVIFNHAFIGKFYAGLHDQCNHPLPNIRETLRVKSALEFCQCGLAGIGVCHGYAVLVFLGPTGNGNFAAHHIYRGRGLGMGFDIFGKSILCRTAQPRATPGDHFIGKRLLRVIVCHAHTGIDMDLRESRQNIRPDQFLRIGHSLGLGQVLPGERAKMIPTAQDFFRWHLFLVSQTL